MCPGSVSLRAAVVAHTAVRGTSAAEPPRIRWPISGFRMTVPVTAVLLVLVLGAAVSLSQPLVLLGAIPLIGNAWWQREGALLMLQPAVIEEGQLLPSQVMARIRAEAELAGPSPLDRVDVVKAAYGRLLGDIVYRIENCHVVSILRSQDRDRRLTPSVPATALPPRRVRLMPERRR